MKPYTCNFGKTIIPARNRSSLINLVKARNRCKINPPPGRWQTIIKCFRSFAHRILLGDDHRNSNRIFIYIYMVLCKYRSARDFCNLVKVNELLKNCILGHSKTIERTLQFLRDPKKEFHP